MTSVRNNPDSEENQRADKENRRYIGGLKLQEKLSRAWREAEELEAQFPRGQRIAEATQPAMGAAPPPKEDVRKATIHED